MWAVSSGKLWECGGGSANENECKRLAVDHQRKLKAEALELEDAAFTQMFGVSMKALEPSPVVFRDASDRFIHRESGREFSRSRMFDNCWTEVEKHQSTAAWLSTMGQLH